MSQEPINTYDQLSRAEEIGLVPIAIVESWTGFRKRYLNGYAVYHLRQKTDPKSHFMDYGKKVFSTFGEAGTHHEKMAKSLAAAKEWVKEKYGVSEWEKNSHRDFVPAPLNTKFPLKMR